MNALLSHREEIAALGRPAEGDRTGAATRRAALVSRDVAVQRWGRLGLGQAGFEAVVCEDLEAARDVVASLGAGDVAVVDARGRRGREVLSALATELSTTPATTFAVYGHDAELSLALEIGVADVSRFPVAWNVLGRRALRLAEAAEATGAVERLRGELSEIRRLAEAAEDRLNRTGQTDPLTSLPNRAAFERMVNRVVAGGAGATGSLAVLALDLDGFQRVNETFGHAAGNEVLQQAAKRLTGYLHRPRAARSGNGLRSVVLARVGGDEFALMLSPSPGQAGLEQEATWIQDALAEPFRAGGEELYVTATIGVSVFPEDGRKAEWLLQSAESAMATSKAEGGGVASFYCAASYSHSKRFLEISRQLHGAIERGEMSIAYQPLIDSRSMRVKAVEALLRWDNPELGKIGPSEFIPVAEECGLMIDIGRWVMRTACIQLREWTDGGEEQIRLAVNVSLCQIARSDLAADLQEIVEETGWDPRQIEIELSERGVLRADPSILRQLHELRELGVRLSVDDFGTGNSAISYLKQFPLDTLKVDQGYIAGAASNEHDAAIIEATIAMAHGLQLNVVAEGVEDEAQRDFLLAHGCDELQGFFFARPLSADALRPMLSRQWGSLSTGGRNDDRPGIEPRGLR